MRRSTILEGLEQALRNPAMCDKLFACKLFALFALGEAYSTRATLSGNQFPGTEPLLEGFLSGSELDLSFLEPSIVDDSFQAFFWVGVNV